MTKTQFAHLFSFAETEEDRRDLSDALYDFVANGVYFSIADANDAFYKARTEALARGATDHNAQARGMEAYYAFALKNTSLLSPEMIMFWTVWLGITEDTYRRMVEALE